VLLNVGLATVEPVGEHLCECLRDEAVYGLVGVVLKRPVGQVREDVRLVDRNMVITAAKLTQAKGGCPLGSLVGQLAENDPEARALMAAGFDQWAAALGDGLRSLQAEGKLPSDIDPDDLATTLLATLEGGTLLAQVLRTTRPFETAVDTLLALTLGR
jgi:DNA-binding NarL/FixJ family response regulator